MNRKRKNNKSLPQRVYVKDGAYKFLAPEKIRDPADGKLKFWIKLASLDDGIGAMHTALGKLLGDRKADAGGVPYLCTEFKANKLGKYSKEVQTQYSQYLDVVAADFEDFSVKDVTTRHWSEFLRNNYAGKANTAKKITALARRLFRYAISELGLREDNPIDQIDLDGYETSRREIIPTHEQVAAIRAAGFIGKDGRRTASGPTLACLIDISYLCWQRAKEFRELKEDQISQGRIRFKPSKTAKTSGAAVDITVTPAIAAVLARAHLIKAKYGIRSDYVFPAITGRHAGKPYTKNGLHSMWDRARERARIADEIQFRDLRALAATDAARQGKSETEIKDRLVHTDVSTSRIYIKDVVPTTSEMDLPLPWNADNTGGDDR